MPSSLPNTLSQNRSLLLHRKTAYQRLLLVSNVTATRVCCIRGKDCAAVASRAAGKSWEGTVATSGLGHA